MGMPAARVTDMHTCPMVTGLVPHVGGPIIPPCAPTVLIGGLPAARVTDMCICAGPPDMIVKGSMSVFIMGQPAARIGDLTTHGGVIVTGQMNVLIGDLSSGGAGQNLGGGAPTTDLDAENELLLDLAQLALDIAGIVEPTPFSDGTNALLSIYRGNFLDSFISAASMLPYLGDLAKAGKLPKFIKTIDRACALIHHSPRSATAKLAKPLLRKIRDAIKSIPTDNLPASAADFLAATKGKIDNAFLDDLASQGHGPQRHEGLVTRQELEDRVLTGKVPDLNSPLKKIPRTATRIKQPGDFVDADEMMRSSDEFIRSPTIDGEKVVEIPLKQALGPDYLSKVEGVSRVGSVKNPAGAVDADLSDGTLRGIYRMGSDGNWNMHTMFPVKE